MGNTISWRCSLNITPITTHLETAGRNATPAAMENRTSIEGEVRCSRPSASLRQRVVDDGYFNQSRGTSRTVSQKWLACSSSRCTVLQHGVLQYAALFGS